MKKNIKRIQINRWFDIKALLTVGLVGFCLGVWPGYLIHTYQTVDLYPNSVTQTQWLSTGDVVQQYFSPIYDWLYKIQVAIDFDKSIVSDEYLYFTILDDTGKTIYREDIYFNQIPEGRFFDIVVEKKLNTKREYMWTLTMPETTDLQYTVLCTDDTSGRIEENRALCIDNANTQHNAVTQYDYYAHYDKLVIIGGFWTGAILVWLMLLELTDRTERFFYKREENDKEEKIF